VKQVGVYGWGIVAPRSPDIEAFERNLESAESWLAPFHGFGPDNFLVGRPEMDFQVYREWIDARFPPSRYSQLVSKMDPSTLYAVAGFIQALAQNPGLEEVLQELGTGAHVYLGTGLASISTLHDASLELDRAQRIWDRFWASPERCDALRRYREDPEGVGAELGDVPRDPALIGDEEERLEAARAWNHYWAIQSGELAGYLDELREIEALSVEGDDVESAKLGLIREKKRRRIRLQEKWGAPEPPWSQVTTNVIWNIPNTPASQVSMMGRITGLAMAPVAACSTFGVCLKLGMDAIRRGEAKAVVVGATDGPPHPLVVGAFYNARVLSADGTVSKPLTGLRGTHVSGGSAIWIIGEREFMESRGMRPLGLEPVAVGVSSDADHIITPSREGPTMAVRRALEEAGIGPESVQAWDLHATATPGDFLEVDTMRAVFPENVVVTARKGTFGHGMAAGGGWELTAQFLGAARGVHFPTPLQRGELNPTIAEVHEGFVYDEMCPAGNGAWGKLSMGVGGINACVVSRALDGDEAG
jgi:3-oxoacyl-[acyl-carrier-protein] synthase II